MIEAIPAVKIVVPDAGPINTLAAAGLLDLLMAPKNTTLVLVDEVVREIVSMSEPLRRFMERHAARIEVAETELGKETKRALARGETQTMKHRGELAAIEFVTYGIEGAVGKSPALVIYEDKKLPRARLQEEFASNVHLITTAAYIRKLATEGVIESFEKTWREVVRANDNAAPRLRRQPSPDQREIPAEGGSEIVFR